MDKLNETISSLERDKQLIFGLGLKSIANHIDDALELLKEQKELLEKKQHDIDQMCVENSRLKHLLNNYLDGKPNCEAVEKSPAGCLGYGKSSTDDEPCEVCKNCPKQQSYGIE